MRSFWRRYSRNKMAVFGLALVIVLVLTAVFADLIAPYSYREQTPEFRVGPSRDHWFGTDTVGRDLFSRVVYGARISLKVGVLATVMAVVIGTSFGAIAGFFGGGTDSLMMRIVDIFLSIPYIILAVSIATLFGRSVNSLIIVLGLTGWLAIARVVRASFLSIKKMEYAEAARALGFGKTRMIFGHLLPNASVPIIVYGTIAIGAAILSEAALSFIGVGTDVSDARVGTDGRRSEGLVDQRRAHAVLPRVRHLHHGARLRARRRWSARRSRPEDAQMSSEAVDTCSER